VEVVLDEQRQHRGAGPDQGEAAGERRGERRQVGPVPQRGSERERVGAVGGARGELAVPQRAEREQARDDQRPGVQEEREAQGEGRHGADRGPRDEADQEGSRPHALGAAAQVARRDADEEAGCGDAEHDRADAADTAQDEQLPVRL
jgi:hypothetical protein